MNAGSGRAVHDVGLPESRAQGESWAGPTDPRTIHVTQFRSPFSKGASDGLFPDCGPASVLMALRLLDDQVPGIDAPAGAQAKVDRIRHSAMGDWYILLNEGLRKLGSDPTPEPA